MANTPDILPNQNLDIKNLMSIRYKGPQADAQAHLAKAADFARENNLKLRGVPISANYGLNPETQEVAMEVYYPIDREFTSNDPDIVFKPRLYLHNCVRVTHVGDPANLQETHTALNQYLVENKLVPISVGFSVSSMDGRPADINEFEMDIYISVSPNIV